VVKRLAAVRVLLSVEVFVRFQTRIVGVAELSGLLVGNGVTRLRALATAGLLA
jgi:hypothetical protein